MEQKIQSNIENIEKDSYFMYEIFGNLVKCKLLFKNCISEFDSSIKIYKCLLQHEKIRHDIGIYTSILCEIKNTTLIKVIKN